MTQISMADSCKISIAGLQEKLLASSPEIPLAIREIHTIFSSDPEVVTLLAPQEIGVIVSGLKKYMNVTLVEKVMKTKTSPKGGKALNGLIFGYSVGSEGRCRSHRLKQS
ncbi:MAG: hypothetical protein ING33_09870 [Rhodocyclaceae bacterium]|nr:hypothetical protein [Rhodocyclaceae bacterium]